MVPSRGGEGWLCPPTPACQSAPHRHAEKGEGAVFGFATGGRAFLGAGSKAAREQKPHYLIPKVKVERPQHRENWPRGR